MMLRLLRLFKLEGSKDKDSDDSNVRGVTGWKLNAPLLAKAKTLYRFYCCFFESKEEKILKKQNKPWLFQSLDIH